MPRGLDGIDKAHRRVGWAPSGATGDDCSAGAFPGFQNHPVDRPHRHFRAGQSPPSPPWVCRLAARGRRLLSLLALGSIPWPAAGPAPAPAPAMPAARSLPDDSGGADSRAAPPAPHRRFEGVDCQPKALISLRRIPNHEEGPGDHGVEAAVLEGDRLRLVAAAATGDGPGRPFRGRARVAKKVGPGRARFGAEPEPDLVAVPNAGRRRRARCDPRVAAPPPAPTVEPDAHPARRSLQTRRSGSSTSSVQPASSGGEIERSRSGRRPRPAINGVEVPVSAARAPDEPCARLEKGSGVPADVWLDG